VIQIRFQTFSEEPYPHRTPFGSFQCFHHRTYGPISKPQSPPRFSTGGKALLNQIISPLNQKEIEEKKQNKTKHTFLLFLIPTQKWRPPYPSPSCSPTSPPCTTKPPALLSHATQNPFTYAPSLANPSLSKPSPLQSSRKTTSRSSAMTRPWTTSSLAWSSASALGPPPPSSWPSSATSTKPVSYPTSMHRGASPPTGYPSLGPRRPPVPSPV
jgi:hypothetical protein